jgi:hypothetical protein
MKWNCDFFGGLPQVPESEFRRWQPRENGTRVTAIAVAFRFEISKMQ